MRKLLNTLYVTTPNSYLSKDGLNVVITVDQKEIFRIPVINIESIVTFGYMGVSPGLMSLCNDNGVSLTFLSPNGRFIARMQGETKGNVLLRTRQYKCSDDKDFTLNIDKIIIAAKVQNSRNVLARFVRDYGENNKVEYAVNSLSYKKNEVLKSTSIEQLRGIEGDSANTYFSVFDDLILNQKEDFSFNGRNRRPPKDAVNALLSLSYTLLANDVAAALETVGLDPYVGFMHTLRPGRASLALDILEEFRAYICDRFVLSLINRRQICIRDFVSQGENGIVLTPEGRKIFLSAWQKRKKEEITHPYLKEKVPLGLLPYVQSLLLARYIRKDIDNYPVFLSK